MPEEMKFEPVILRVWIGSEARKDGSIHYNGLLFFPCEPSEYYGYHCQSYGWDGHGGANYNGLVSKTRQATDEEYAEFMARYEPMYNAANEEGFIPLKRYRRQHPFMYEEYQRRQKAYRTPKETPNGQE